MTEQLPFRSNPEDRVMSAVSSGEAPSRTSAIAWATVPGHVVDGGEIVLLAVKPSMWRPLFDSAGWLMVTGAIALALLWTERSFGSLSPVATAQLVMMIGLIRMGAAVARWIPTWYLLTNRRVIHVHGVRTPRIHDRALLEIRNTYLQATPAERVCRLGTIRFVPDPPDSGVLYWQSIAQPEEVHRKIRRAIENALDANH